MVKDRAKLTMADQS